MSNEVKPVYRERAANPAGSGGVLNAAVGRLSLLINSRNPIITVETSEEQRFLAVLEQVADQLEIPLYVWSVTTGLARAAEACTFSQATS